jgi:hypothetical protein
MEIHCCPSCYSQQISFGDDYVNAFTCGDCGHIFPEWGVEVIEPIFVYAIQSLNYQSSPISTDINDADIPF